MNKKVPPCIINKKRNSISVVYYERRQSGACARDELHANSSDFFAWWLSIPHSSTGRRIDLQAREGKKERASLKDTPMKSHCE